MVDGDTPSMRRNVRLMCAASEKPASMATRVSVWSETIPSIA
jgi:hypothetical protein